MHIQTLTLHSRHLSECVRFYADVLGLQMLYIHDNHASITIGTSTLHLIADAQRPDGVYHFAFNIPHNQLVAGGAWLSERVALLADEHGETRFTFADWNAEASYCKDPDGNILEIIARHSLANGSDQPFSVASLLNISEIGMAVTDVDAAAQRWSSAYGLAPYGETDSSFTPLGDENGLLVIVPVGRKWFPERVQAAVALAGDVTFQTGEREPVTLPFVSSI